MKFTEGILLEKYELSDLPINFGHKIGEGASAEVFRYRSGSKIMAIKIFRNAISCRKTLRFVRKLVSLEHKNVVQFLGYSLRPSALGCKYCQLMIENEYIDNVAELLEIWNDDENYFFSNRMNIVMQAASGIKALHDNSILHKDIKPANLLVSGLVDKIIVKVSDFDDLHEIKNSFTTTRTNLSSNDLCGCTLAYSACELCLQQVSSPSFATDIYSVAIMAYEIFSAISPPWKKVLPIYNDALLINTLMSNKRPPVDFIKEKYSPDDCDVIIPVILNGWHPDPLKRPGMSDVCYHSIPEKLHFEVK